MSQNGGDNIKFSVIVSLFTWIQKTKTTPKKRLKFRKFLDAYVTTPSDSFASIRLLLPSLDRDRGSYGLKEHVLATCIIDGLGMSRDSRDAVKLVNWRKGGGGGGGGGVGNFGMVAEEVLRTRLGSVSGGMSVRELNDLLDRLASAENRGEKTSLLSELMRKTNAQEMKWIIMIILKDLKLGISEKSIFHEFHPDAEDLFNVTCDLKLVCEKLRDRTQRHKRQDIEVGKAVRPQLALRVNNAAAAWKKFHGKQVVLECKFDGDRIQIHKNHSETNFFSRNFLDHQEYSHGMSDIIAQNILAERCILDGEMLVWDTSTNRFADFGSNQEIAKAAKEGLDSDRQLCYVAFDILYVGDTSVIHQSLNERHELLRKVVKPIKGRLEILVPHGGLNARRPSGEPCWSLVAHDVDEVEKFFKETVENRDEGIVLKDLGSKWEPSDRSGKWLKLKPDYVRAGSDLDVLIIGGYYGSGRRGGEVAQFLVGIADRPTANTHPRRFLSFCRVGTGLSNEELETVVTKLKPYFRKNDYPKKAPPSFYQVTNNSKERPDVWIESPEKSIILSITSDIRTISSEVFAAPYSLRFPRIDRVRYDKPWYECLDLESFVELVHSSNGNTQKQSVFEAMQDSKPNVRRRATSRKGEKNISTVPSHFIQTDVSHIKSETSIFSNMVLYFVNVPSSHSLDSIHKMVAEHGGTFSMNLNNSVTHCIAAECKGIKFQAAKLHGDIIHCSWLFDCNSQRKLIPLQPKYFLFLSDSTKKKLQEEIDEFSDSYYLDLDLTDVRQILGNVDHLVDPKTISYYEKKYCPKEKWIMFHDCCIYFYLPTQYMNSSDWKVLMEIASTRLRIEVSFGGGRVGDDLFHATHFVVMSEPDHNVDFSELLCSFSAAEQRLLRNKRLHVVSSQWLEESLKNEQKLSEESYTLRSTDQEDSIAWESEHDESLRDSSSLALRKEKSVTDDVQHSSKSKVNLDEPGVITLPPRSGQRKRGRPIVKASDKGKAIVKQPWRTRARAGSKPVKICEDEPVECVSEKDQTVKESSESDAENYVSHEKSNDHITESTVNEHVENSMILGDKEPCGDAECNMETDALHDARETEYNMETDALHYAHDRSHENDRTGKELIKSEQIEDPVQAMMFGLIPSLGTQKEKAESSKPVPVDENLTDEGKPVKKKKVSYKEMADELLKDW